MVGYFERPVISLNEEEVETVTNALAVYIDHLATKYGGEAPRPITGPWVNGKDPNCLHQQTTDITTLDAVLPSAREVLCSWCGATQTTVDSLDAVRGTARAAIELRRRIVKEWGWDPTEG